MANKTARLGDLATYINGYAFKPADWGDTGLPIIRIQDLTGNSYQLNRYDGEYPERIEVNDGDVLISWSASLGVYVWQRGKALLNQHIFKVVFDKIPVNKEYFVFAVEHKLAEMESKTHGATMKHIVKKDFDGTTIPYPPIEKQAEIADHLRRITSLIDRQTEQLLLLDQLVKSRFIELFGDPIKNTQHRPTTAFVNVVTMQRGFDLPVQDRKQSGNIPVYGSNGVLDHHNQAKVCNGGVITGRSGTIGKVFYTTGAYWPLNTTLFSVDTHENNIIYLAHLVRMFNLDRFTEGTGVPTLNRNKFHSAPIIDVPIDEQNQFAAFVEQTDKSKYYSSLSFRYCQAAANTYRQEWMTCRTSDF